MTFDDLQTGDTVFVDANTFIYHFANHAKFGAPARDSWNESNSKIYVVSRHPTAWPTWHIES